MNERWLKTIIANHGSLEAYRDKQRKWGAKGGKFKNPKKGFGSNKQLAVQGGQRSRKAK